jgi:type I restriction enzyme S subunit
MKEGWELKTLGDVCVSASSNVSQNKLADDEGEYPIFGASGLIKKVSFYHRDKPYLSIVKDGSGFGRVTKMDAYTSVIGTLQYILPKENIDLDYLNYSLMSVDFKKYVAGAAIPHIYFKDYKNEAFLCMPLPEQQRIVAILDECFAALEKAKANAEQNLKNAKELFESYLQGVFENKGEGWEEKPLREVCYDFLQGINTATDKTVFVDEGIPILQAKEIGLNKLDLRNTKFITRDKFEVAAERYKPKEGDILYNNIGSSMGRSIIVDWDFDFTIAWNVMRIIPNRTITLPKFLNYMLQSHSVYNNIIFKAKGVGMPFISKKDLIEIMVSYPSLSDQQTIVSQLDALRAETQKLEAVYQQKLADLEELKKSILQKAFAGELTDKSKAS